MKHLKTLLGKGFNLGARGLLAVTALGLAAPASAVPVINTTVDQSLGDCSITCSLRDAVALSSSGDTLHVPAGHYVLTLGEIVFPKSLTLVGDGARSTVLDGNGASRIFVFETYIGEETVELVDLSLINGLATTPAYGGVLGGGALRGNAILTLRRCRLAGNKAQAGGAIFWDNFLTIDQCTIADNVATSQAYDGLAGGGIFAASKLVTITNSTLTGNTASAGYGGAIAALRKYIRMYNVTVTANEALSGGGVYLKESHLIIFNTIIADNSGINCRGNWYSIAPEYSLDSDHSCVGGPGDLPGVAPLLGPLANNGGPTDTHALLAGSPALDAGGSTTCQATDQRGVIRPQGPGCDIGAFEGFVPSTPQDQIAALIAEIDALVTGGTLAPNKANPLLTKLNQVVDKLDASQTSKACGHLGAFVNQVNAYIRNGNLTAVQGQVLIDATNALRADIGC